MLERTVRLVRLVQTVPKAVRATPCLRTRLPTEPTVPLDPMARALAVVAAVVAALPVVTPTVVGEVVAAREVAVVFPDLADGRVVDPSPSFSRIRMSSSKNPFFLRATAVRVVRAAWVARAEQVPRMDGVETLTGPTLGTPTVGAAARTMAPTVDAGVGVGAVDMVALVVAVRAVLA